MRSTLLRPTVLAAALSLGQHALADTILSVDVRAPAPEPVAGTIKTGTANAPGGHAIGINNQYLTRDGQPWLPVAGEFHYSRSPAASWDGELAKMKAAGIDIVTSYIIWSHHEPQQGRFDWSGNRDLRRFVQLAHKHGLQVVVRIGPWAHAEVRYGGFPDWVVDAMPTRRSDPQYMQHVARLYREIGRQIDGLLYKQGGPVVAAQLENEYNLAGPERGAGHILALKTLAIEAGIDVPLYTVTGWDHTLYPSGEVTPVFGGYPDEPWATSTKELGPKETYAFRFDTRVSGDLGAQTRATQKGTAETDIDKTPFLGAEYGAGLPAMYRRRTLVSPDDIASMLPVQLGSGVNLMGYYMFHGGRNPVGGTTLEESTRSGGYNDTPAISYDFNAPLGPDGQQRPVLAALRPFHYFLRDFGSRLAPMAVRKPDAVPADPSDLSTPRWSVRSRGDAAFLFYNGHVRQYALAAPKDLRFEVKLPGGTLTLPSKPVEVPAGSYFIWPLNFDMDGHLLRYATAQPVTVLDEGAKRTWVFAAQAGVPVEFAFGAAERACVQGRAGSANGGGGGEVLVDGIVPGQALAFSLRCAGRQAVDVLVLPAEGARRLFVGEVAGRRRLVLSEAQAYADHGRLVLRSAGEAHVAASVYPALPARVKTSAKLAPAAMDGVFQVLSADLPRVDLAAKATPLRDAQPAPAVRIGGSARAALLPDPEAFGASAAWRIEVPRVLPKGVDGALLDIDFSGDVARLFDGTRMLDDWYYNGQRWQYDLRNLGNGMQGTKGAKGPLTLTVLPLRADAPIYLPREARPEFGAAKQLARVDGVKVVPVYRLEVGP